MRNTHNNRNNSNSINSYCLQSIAVYCSTPMDKNRLLILLFSSSHIASTTKNKPTSTTSTKLHGRLLKLTLKIKQNSRIGFFLEKLIIPFFPEGGGGGRRHFIIPFQTLLLLLLFVLLLLLLLVLLLSLVPLLLLLLLLPLLLLLLLLLLVHPKRQGS